MLEKIEKICDVAVDYTAEDVFLQVGELPSMRVKGKVLELEDEPITEEEMKEFMLVCGLLESDCADADLSWESGGGMRYRVNFYRSMGRRCAVLRLLKVVDQSLDELGLPQEMLEEWLQRPHGLILLTGATGSGKSTTLASCLNWIIQNDYKHVVTVEDPVEYILNKGRSMVSQREVGTDTASFSTGLRAAMRQSPDVILVGEIRDYETAQVALHACETGHLVLSTLHSSNVGETVDRLLMLFPSAEREVTRNVISKQLIGVVTQKLVPCADKDELMLLLEYMSNAGAVRQWLQDGDINKISDFVRKGQAGAKGNKSFMESVIQAFKSGQISEAVAKSACGDPHEFSRMMLGVSHGSR